MHLSITVKPLTLLTELLFGESCSVIILMEFFLKVIFNVYDNAKSCVKAGENMSMFFSSMAGVRQDENLSPILFSLFLNDLVQFMSNSYNGLSTLSEDTGSIFNNDDIEVFFKLYLLLYAEDMVVFAESPEELQTALDTMQSYFDTWKLQVNTS